MPRAVVRALGCFLGLLGAQGQVTSGGGLDPVIFEDDYCKSGEDEPLQSFNVGTMGCGTLMEFVYLTRYKTWQLIEELRVDANSGGPTTWKLALRSVSRGASLLSAHVHILAAIASQRTECFSEHVRLLLIVNLRRQKALSTAQLRLLWSVAQDGYKQEDLYRNQKRWLGEAAELLDADLRTLRTVLRAWVPPVIEEARFYSHEADGRFSTMEALRRDTFDEWPLDRGLLQALLRFVLPMDVTVADVGAGSGKYSEWLNDTGLVTAYAFDGSPDVELVTKGRVLSADLGRPLNLWRRFDWVLCLEVAEHVQPDLTPTFLGNLDAHAEHGVVLSWARPGDEGLGHMNPQSEQEVLKLIQEHTSLYLDRPRTEQLRAAAGLPALAESVLVLTRHPPDMLGEHTGSCPAHNPQCNARPRRTDGMRCEVEDGWIYAGNDVQMFNDVTSAAACCELCSGNELCRFWTWSSEDTHKDLCWIKSTREYRINHNGFVSGVRAVE